MNRTASIAGPTPGGRAPVARRRTSVWAGEISLLVHGVALALAGSLAVGDGRLPAGATSTITLREAPVERLCAERPARVVARLADVPLSEPVLPAAPAEASAFPAAASPQREAAAPGDAVSAWAPPGAIGLRVAGRPVGRVTAAAPAPRLPAREPRATVPRPAPVPVPPTAARPRDGGCPKPGYPRRARARGQQGTVLVAVAIGADGTVASVAVERSSGFPGLDEAACSALAAWSFVPATENGRPVASRLVIPVDFRLQ